MLNVFYVNIKEKSLDEWFDVLKKKASIERLRLSNRFKFKEDSVRCLLSEALLLFALKKTFKIDARRLIRKDVYGKPYIDKDVHFNISHSGNYVICVVSKTVVGIDIEEIRPIDYKELSNCFTAQEKKQLADQNESKIIDMFYTFWVLKESYIKYTGEGFSFPLDKCSFYLMEKNIEYKNLCRENENIIFDLLFIHEDYKCAVCHQKYTDIDQLCELKFSDFT